MMFLITSFNDEIRSKHIPSRSFFSASSPMKIYRNPIGKDRPLTTIFSNFKFQITSLMMFLITSFNDEIRSKHIPSRSLTASSPLKIYRNPIGKDRPLTTIFSNFKFQITSLMMFLITSFYDEIRSKHIPSRSFFSASSPMKIYRNPIGKDRPLTTIFSNFKFQITSLMMFLITSFNDEIRSKHIPSRSLTASSPLKIYRNPIGKDRPLTTIFSNFKFQITSLMMCLTTSFNDEIRSKHIPSRSFFSASSPMKIYRNPIGKDRPLTTIFSNFKFQITSLMMFLITSFNDEIRSKHIPSRSFFSASSPMKIYRNPIGKDRPLTTIFSNLKFQITSLMMFLITSFYDEIRSKHIPSRSFFSASSPMKIYRNPIGKDRPLTTIFSNFKFQITSLMMFLITSFYDEIRSKHIPSRSFFSASSPMKIYRNPIGKDRIGSSSNHHFFKFQISNHQFDDVSHHQFL